MNEMHRCWADNIRRGRTLLGIRQYELAEACDVRPSTVSKWESAGIVPSDLHKVRIAEALHQDVRSLFPLVSGPR